MFAVSGDEVLVRFVEFIWWVVRDLEGLRCL